MLVMVCLHCVAVGTNKLMLRKALGGASDSLRFAVYLGMQQLQQVCSYMCLLLLLLLLLLYLLIIILFFSQVSVFQLLLVESQLLLESVSTHCCDEVSRVWSLVTFTCTM